MAELQQSIANDFFGRGYSVFFNSDGIAEIAREQAREYHKLSAYSIAELGAGWQDGLDMYEASINAEVVDEGGDQ